MVSRLGRPPVWAWSPLFLGLTMCAPASPAPPEPATPPPAAISDPSIDAAHTAAAAADSTATAALPRAERAADSGSALSPDLEKLWQRRIATRLKRETWRNAQRYDAAYLYMLPLHAAFERRYESGQQEFAEHVGRFMGYRDSVQLKAEAQISWLQYFFFLSRFSVLAAEHDRADLVPAELPKALRGWIGGLWLAGPAWQWFRKPFPGGIRERVEWKLSDAPGVKGHAFEHAILDQELLLFAIAADLRRYGRAVGSPLANDPVLEEIGRYARRVYEDRVVWTADSAWTFQPGIWRDHPDHLYECRQEKRPGLEPCTTTTGAEDASHSHRLPLLLRSMAQTEATGSPARAYYERLLGGLERQFFGKVVVPPSAEFAGWRMRNYMDGQNGLYRWGYKQFGKDEGYGPYELSFALLSSWWGFLPGERARKLYRELAGQFPLSPQLLTLYVGPSPLGRPKGQPNAILVDGTTLLLCRLASEQP